MKEDRSVVKELKNSSRFKSLTREITSLCQPQPNNNQTLNLSSINEEESNSKVKV